VAARWRVDLKARAITSAAGLPAGETAGTHWEVAGPIGLWAQVVEGRLNLSVALRRRLLRYRDQGDPTPAMLNRIAMLADLLGITTWQRADPAPRPYGANGSLRANGPERPSGRAPVPGPRQGSDPVGANGPRRAAAQPAGHGDGPGRGRIFSSGDVPAPASRPARSTVW